LILASAHAIAAIVDGFDINGQPPELCSQGFYDECYRSLTPSGLMVVNLCGWEGDVNISRIGKKLSRSDLRRNHRGWKQ
jgi:spermidine synthase